MNTTTLMTTLIVSVGLLAVQPASAGGIECPAEPTYGEDLSCTYESGSGSLRIHCWFSPQQCIVEGEDLAGHDVRQNCGVNAASSLGVRVACVGLFVVLIPGN